MRKRDRHYRITYCLQLATTCVMEWVRARVDNAHSQYLSATLCWIRPRLIAANKSDMVDRADRPWDVEALHNHGCPVVEISALTGDGLERLRDRIASALDTAGGLRADPG